LLFVSVRSGTCIYGIAGKHSYRLVYYDVTDGKVGDYILTARKKGNDWFVSAMTDWTARDLSVDLSFWMRENMKQRFVKMASMPTDIPQIIK
jgi:hypothetical protein